MSRNQASFHPSVLWLIFDVLLAVMIVSYETLRTLTVYLAGCSIGLLLCDEGHRLKNSGECLEVHYDCQSV